tara:strand:- start:506 stop:787 length:282 start_codon:yes stop_codon:yes gene_type:complete
MKAFDPHTTQLVFYADAGHAWLAVPLDALEDLEIADDISQYSYQSKSKGLVYLEEDMDAGTFIQAFKKKYGFPPNWIETYHHTSHVRNLERYA